MSDFASVRCLSCGSPTAGGQFCAGCVERRQAEEERRAERLAASQAAPPPANVSGPAGTGSLCPSCGRFVSGGANFCGFCRRPMRELAPGQAGELVYAGFWIRLLAALIDGVILIIFNIFASLVSNDAVTAFFLYQFLAAAYTIGFWVGQGATPGKMAVGIKVVMANGEPLELGPAVLRYFGYIASGLILGIGYLMIAFTAEKRGLHDFIGGTVVIKSR